MKVLIDCRYVRVGHHDGISRFTASLVAALAARELPDLRLELLISDERQLTKLPELPWHRIPSPTSPGEPFVARHVNRLEPDVVYTPMQTMGSLGRRYRFVSTLHDLIYYAHPTPPRDLPWFVRVAWRLYHRAWWPQRLLLNGADLVVTVSETTKRLMREHRLTRRDIVVVPNASDLPPRVERDRPTDGVLVYMGSFMPYKDVDTVVRAMRELPGHELHLLSRIAPAERDRLLALAPEARIVVHDGVTDDEYRALLARATALVSASRDEGFGIPLVEAMGHGTPVVVTDIPIFREIGGSAAAFFPAGDAHALAARIRELDADWPARSAASRARAEFYDWDRSADILLDVLRKVSARPAPRRARR
ncbi:glycosyltransferase involved in cell wall biosynthesis [Diaminobutyricimonas aerilata]|uniref:Glycosyltransferase involved in cell wall biosynthesis n=1 Tax=Diaminobutyricimonas aerilata TaxID=1162967 RepID=A0A2M9CJY0_9MICO|nr:glycosyltransferase family 1 protein [Diaminobutyricimonas aerilata]PJJ72190.1 glycosyltransferase involved in cell wall biosynthesis [Diaminobutyricimonas aerilata]